jgi:hypothetical protein
MLRDTSILATEEDLIKIDNFIKTISLEREKIEVLNSNIQDNFEESFGHLFILKPGTRDFGSQAKNSKNKRKLHFLQEWRETQNYLNLVKNLILNNCHEPKWIHESAHPTIITDQLLHAYYFTYVLKGTDEGKGIEKVNGSYEKNKVDPAAAVLRAIKWWETLEEAPDDEDVHINEWGPSNRETLAKLRSKNLELKDLLLIMNQNHAARNHARQINNNFFGLPGDFKTDIDHRVKIYSEWLFNEKSPHGLSINEILRYILFQDDVPLEERIYNTIYDEKYHIEHFGRSIIGEIVGWGRPDITHLRNNRVNKALRCLGYDVRLFSE